MLRFPRPPLRSALVTGVFGGSLMSAGMELIGTESPPVRFAGLQLTAVGASVARNAASGAPMLSDITLPIYPLYVRVRPGTSTPITARVSVMTATRLATLLTAGGHPTVDWRATVATGAPVLRSPRWRLPSESCPPPCEGSFAQHNAGVIVYSSSAGTDYDLRRTLAHESLHLAQQTRDAVLDAIPASDARSAAWVRAVDSSRASSSLTSSCHCALWTRVKHASEVRRGAIRGMRPKPGHSRPAARSADASSSKLSVRIANAVSGPAPDTTSTL